MRIDLTGLGGEMHMHVIADLLSFLASVNYAENKVIAVRLAVRGHVFPILRRIRNSESPVAFFCVQMTHSVACHL